jgi:hypothetical protein
MYIPTKVQSLSNPQINKMLNGHPVRVKIGSGIGHIVHLSQEQAKKLNKASLKGSGFTIRMDPYQIVQHRNLQGQGILSHLKKHAVHHIKKHGKHLANQALHHGMSMAQSAINKHIPEFGKEYANQALGMAGDYAQSNINQHLQEGQGFFKHAGRYIKHHGKHFGKQLLHTGLSMAEQAAITALPAGLQAIDTYTGVPVGSMAQPYIERGIHKGFSQAQDKTSGLGIHKKKKRGRPRKGGALNPAGY